MDESQNEQNIWMNPKIKQKIIDGDSQNEPKYLMDESQNEKNIWMNLKMNKNI